MNRSVVVAVASYGSKAAACDDLDLVASARYDGGLHRISAALLEKGAGGALTVERYEDASAAPIWTCALLGSALLVVAAPLGILHLAPVVATPSGWAGVAVLVGHLWREVDRDVLRRMGNLAEAGQAALVVVGVDQDGRFVRGLLPRASTTIVSGDLSGDFEMEMATAVEEAGWIG